jgi:RNA polymerase sigma factor (sigma-70 family)
MNDDASLLRCYADEGSEAAFAELVRRHVDLVYGAAMRRTGDPHRAEDVTQKVFISLARGAGKLSRHAVLGAWLHLATRNAAINLMISDQRRRARDLEALAVDSANTPAGDALDWGRLGPVLDSAIDELSPADRDAVVLRFLERRPFAEVGAALRVSEDAARMRTERALDKLRGLLGRRGITSSAAALAAVVSSQPILSAPAGFSATLASHSLAAAGAGAATLASLMTTSTITTAVLSALVAFGAGAYFGVSRSFDAPPPPPMETPQQSQMIASLREANVALRSDADRLGADVIRLNVANAKLAAQATTQAAPPKPRVTRADKQRAMLNNLRQIDAARIQFEKEYGHAPGTADELVGTDKYIRQYQPVDGEIYSGVSMVIGQPLTVTSPDGLTVTYDPSGAATTVPDYSPAELRAQDLGQKVAPFVQKAVEAFKAANNGNSPSTAEPQGLAPYFETPQQGADWVEYVEALKEAHGN